MTEQNNKARSELEDNLYLFSRLCESSRVLANLSPAELAQKTRVPVRFITGIERGEQDLGVSRVYARGFVRILSKHLAANESDWLQAFEEAYPQSDSEMSIEVISKVQRSANQQTLLARESRTSRAGQWRYFLRRLTTKISEKTRKNAGQEPSEVEARDNRLRKIAPVVAGVVVVTGYTIISEGYFQTKFEPQVTKRVPYSTQEFSNGVEVEKQAASVYGKLELSESNSASPKADTTSPEPKPTPVEDSDVLATSATLSVVIVEASDNVLVKVRKDSEARRRVRLDKGAKFKIEFENEAQFLITDASRVSVTFNGEELGALGRPGRTRRISFVNHDYIPQSKM